jgi:pSer/pThr/pTyr-binding forkhead associated (FHA) protein
MGIGGMGELDAPPAPPLGSNVSTGIPGGAAPAPPPLPARPAAIPPQQQLDTRRALAGFLVSYQDDPLGKFWPLWLGKNSIGRSDTGQKVDIEIAHGTTSTHHASIECEGGRFVLSDLGSTNGTFHNEEAIGFKGRRELRDGDKIRFGGFSVITIIVTART